MAHNPREFKQPKQRCCICRKEFEGYGNSPIPVMASGRCCDRCNRLFVIPARLAKLR